MQTEECEIEYEVFCQTRYRGVKSHWCSPGNKTLIRASREQIKINILHNAETEVCRLLERENVLKILHATFLCVLKEIKP